MRIIENFKKLKHILHEYFWSLKFALKTNSTSMIFMIITFCILQLAPVFVIFINQFLVGILENNLTMNSEIIANIIILFVCFILVDVGNVIYMLFYEKIRYLISNKLFEKVIKKVNNLPIEFYEDHENQVMLERIINTSRYSLHNLISNNLSFYSAIVELIVYTTLICLNAWYMIFIMLLFAFVPYLFRMKEVEERSDLDYKLAGEYKKQSYYNDILFNRNHAKEIRINDVSNKIINKWNNRHDYTLSQQEKIFNKWNSINHIKDCFESICKYIFLGILIFLLSNDFITLVAFVFLYQVQAQLNNSINWFCRIVPDSYNEVRKLDECKDFIESSFNRNDEEMIVTENIDSSNPVALKMENVSFKYNSSGFAIKNINLKILKNKTIAILGDNGSGKSTLVKIIMGLYKPDSGKILYFNSDIQNKENIYKLFSCSFQDYRKYELTVRENIGFGNITDIDNDEAIISHMKNTECQEILNKCNNDIDKVLGKLFDFEGIELSEGQWQRMANSRTLFKDSEITIFDEPTARLDPIAELNEFEKIKKKAENKTSIFISHRIGFAKFADYIYVLKNGEIVEEGTHTKLLEANGEYYQMYMNQKKWYFGAE